MLSSYIKKFLIGFLFVSLFFQSMSVSAVTTGAGYSPYPQELLKKNSQVLYDNNRFSLFLVLSRLSLEELNKMLNECLSMAFSGGEFSMSAEMIGKTIDQSFKDGMANFLAEYLAPGSNDYADAFYDKLQAESAGRYEEKADSQTLKDECVNKCMADGMDGTECQKKCKKENAIKAKAISDLLLEFLTGDLRTQLGPGIQNILNQELRDVIFSKKINDILSTSTLSVLNSVFGGVLNKTIADEVPKLKETLGKKVASYMRPELVKPLEKIDRLLQLCIDDFRNYINKNIDNLVKNMVAEMKNAVDSTKNKTLSEYNIDEDGCCGLGEPWYWGKDASNKERCIAASRGDVNNNWGIIRAGIVGCATKQKTQESFCEEIPNGFYNDTPPSSCWYENKCKQCDIATTRQEALNLKGWLSTLGKNLFTALLSLPKQIMLAVIETAGHTLGEYAKVWVEDELIRPLEPYFNKLAEFQQKFHKTLNYTVADILPKQATDIMTKNADQLLEMICKNTDNMLDTLAGIECKNSSDFDACKNDIKGKACNIYNELHDDLLTQLGESGHLGNEIRNAITSMVFELLPENWQNILNKSIAEIFWPEITNIKNLIKGTPKQFICGELLTENFKVKTASQSSVFDKCGVLRNVAKTIGLLPYIDKEDAFWKGISDELKEKYAISCPIIWYLCQNPLSQWAATIGDTIVRIISNQCDVIDKKTSNKCVWQNYAAAPLPTLPAELKPGCIACKTLNSSLAFILFKLGMEEMYGVATTTGSVTKQTCDAANVSQNLLDSFVCKNKNNKTQAFQCKCQERSAYQWLYLAFPLLRDSANIRDFNGGTKQVALARGFTEAEWDNGPSASNDPNSIVGEIKNYSSLIELPSDISGIAMTFINWMNRNESIKNILTSIPLGVLKPFTPGEATLLRDAGKGEKHYEFLVYEPYEFLENELCRKVITDFNKDYPTSTIEAIMRGEAVRLSEQRAIPYSVESLRSPTVAQAEQILLSISDDQIAADRKAQYLTCFALDKSPADLFGLDQKLIEYVRPEAYKVLFTLIKEKLKESERPTLLNKLLYYLYAWNPVQLACAVLIDESYIGDKSATDFICNFLNTTMGDRVKAYLPREQMICLVAKGVVAQLDIQPDAIIDTTNKTAGEIETIKIIIRDIAKDCFAKQLDKNDWYALQLFLRKSPLQLIKDYLKQQLLDNKYVNAPPVMDYIANHTVLGDRYIDTLGRWLHLDKPIQDFFLAKDDFNAVVDAATLTTIQKIQNSFDKLLIDYPKAAYNWLLKSLGINMGQGMSADISDKVAGRCWYSTEEECFEVQTGAPASKNVYNKTNSECCNMGDGLVCVDRCREIEVDPATGIAKESCKIFEGEASVIMDNGKTYCCFGLYGTPGVGLGEKKENVCNLCRVATFNEVAENKNKGGDAGCLRDPDNKTEVFIKTEYTVGAETKTYNTCCRRRELKDNGTPNALDDTCCINVMQCISDKFIYFLEMFSDALLYGPMRNTLK
jgi:hypothetical protein